MKHMRHLLKILITAVLLVSILIMPAAAVMATAQPISMSVRIDGADKKFEAYLINDNSYFRLRDIAYALNGTAKQFQVTFDAITYKTDLTTGTAYTPIGGEMKNSGSSASITAAPELFTAYVNGTKVTMLSYIIGAYHYVKLRDLASVINFGVTYIAYSNTIAINTSTGYTPELESVPLTELRVSMIGDSLGIGIEPNLKKLLPKLENDSKVSRQFSHSKKIIQSMLQAGTLADTVIIELGTNGTIYESDLRAIIDMMGSGRKIVFVNIQVPRSWCDGNNKTLAKVLPEYPNTIIADWCSTSENKSNYFASDRVHPSPTGRTAMSQIIADAVAMIQ